MFLGIYVGNRSIGCLISVVRCLDSAKPGWLPFTTTMGEGHFARLATLLTEGNQNSIPGVRHRVRPSAEWYLLAVILQLGARKTSRSDSRLVPRVWFLPVRGIGIISTLGMVAKNLCLLQTPSKNEHTDKKNHAKNSEGIPCPLPCGYGLVLSSRVRTSGPKGMPGLRPAVVEAMGWDLEKPGQVNQLAGWEVHVGGLELGVGYKHGLQTYHKLDGSVRAHSNSFRECVPVG